MIKKYAKTQGVRPQAGSAPVGERDPTIDSCRLFVKYVLKSRVTGVMRLIHTSSQVAPKGMRLSCVNDVFWEIVVFHRTVGIFLLIFHFKPVFGHFYPFLGVKKGQNPPKIFF